MATREYRVPAGGNLLDAAGYSWQIGGVSINNPSGFWLEVLNVGIVPPYINEWAVPISPSKTSLTVRSLTQSPSGSLSPGGGAPFTVTISDTGVPASAGVPSGSLALQTATGQDYIYTIQGLGANEAGQTLTLIAAIASTQRAIIVGLGFGYEYGSGASTTNPRTNVGCQFQSFLGAGIVLSGANINPNTPGWWRNFPPGAIVIDPGRSLRVICATTPGGGIQSVTVEALYYLESIPA